jgi:uncharacterized protein YndB with AHSA1/START domain
METGTIIQVERVFPVTSSVLWRALTDPIQMKQWYFDIHGFRAEEGFEDSFAGEGRTGKKFVHECRILEVVRGRKLSHSWSYKDLKGYSEVSFELFPLGNNTKLVLTHKGIPSFSENGPDFALESFTEGWNYIVNKSLQEYVEKMA